MTGSSVRSLLRKLDSRLQRSTASADKQRGVLHSCVIKSLPCGSSSGFALGVGKVVSCRQYSRTRQESLSLTFSGRTEEDDVDACLCASDNLLSQSLVVDLITTVLEWGGERNTWSVDPERSLDAVGSGHICGLMCVG